ncbi:MAG: TFIIB-type zinc ribbon-containing protein [Clostridiales bacterium]|nr:TFIIB-type zinc ribbon-containing protein [Clostridiales bacterium]
MAENLGTPEEQLDVVTAGYTEDVTDKKCPNCGATVVYDPETLAMSCPFCGYSRQLPKPEDNGQDVEELDFSTAKNRESLDWGKSKKSLVCKNCGAETIMDSADTAQCCPYCGSTQVMPVDNDEDVIAPGGVVPFEITKEKATQLFKSWMKGKLFAPNDAKKSCEAKNFSGVYLPYWTYDSQTTSPYEVKLAFDSTDKDGHTSTTYKTYRGIYERFIDDETVYASKKTNNRFIKAASTFDFSKLRKYSPEFIAGFLAERYTVGLDEGWDIAKTQIKAKLQNEIGSMERKKHHADRVSKVTFNTAYSKVTYKYVLAPIWIANFKFKEKIYNIVVNGQTGQIKGEAPVSPLKVIIAIILAILAIMIVCALLNN